MVWVDGELHFLKHVAVVYSRPSLLAVPQGGTILRGLMFGLPTLRMYENLHVVSTHIWDCQPLFQDATKEEAKEEKDQKETLTWGDPKQGGTDVDQKELIDNTSTVHLVCQVEIFWFLDNTFSPQVVKKNNRCRSFENAFILLGIFVGFAHSRNQKPIKNTADMNSFTCRVVLSYCTGF